MPIPLPIDPSGGSRPPTPEPSPQHEAPDLEDLDAELDDLDEDEEPEPDVRVRMRQARVATLRPQPGDTIVLRLLKPCPAKVHAQIDAAFAKQFRHVEGVRTLVLGHDQELTLVRAQPDAAPPAAPQPS